MSVAVPVVGQSLGAGLRVNCALKQVLQAHINRVDRLKQGHRPSGQLHTPRYTNTDTHKHFDTGLPGLLSSEGPGKALREQMELAPAKAKPQGRLLVSTPLDAKDELEEVG